MSDRVAEHVGALARRLARHLNRRISDTLALLLGHKSAGSLGAVAGFAIAVVFVWKFLKSPPTRPRRGAPKRRVLSAAADSEGAGTAPKPEVSDAVESTPLTTGQIVRKKLSSVRKMTCQILGVVLEETSPEDLQKHATVRLPVVELLLEVAKHCDLYLMETVFDDASEERVLLALESAGLFQSGGLMKERSLSEVARNFVHASLIASQVTQRDHIPLDDDLVLFSSSEIGRTSFVRQLESDFHVDTNLEIISQLSRFIRCQLYISPLEAGQIAPNVYTSSSLDLYFSSP